MPGFYGGGMGVSAPLVVGDRLYLVSEPHDLIRLRRDRRQGPVGCAHHAFEAAGSDVPMVAEEQKQPAYEQAEAVAAKLDAINADFVAGAALDWHWHEKKGELEKALGKHEHVAAEKYTPGPAPDIGFSGFTPSSDGKFLYAWFGDGVAACYDLEGNRRWIRVDHRAAVEHGFRPRRC